MSGHFAFWFDSGESIRLVGSRSTHGLAPQQADAEPVHCFIATDSWSMPLSSKGIIYHSCGIARQNWFTYSEINYSALEVAVRRIQQDFDFLMRYLPKLPDDSYAKTETLKILKQHKAYMAQFEEMLNDKEIA